MSSSDPDELRIPLIHEEAHVTKADVVTDRLRVTTSVEERPVLIEDMIEQSDLSVERVKVERAVASIPEPRREGDTLIVSIVEERLVVAKQLFVVEELRIIRQATTRHVSMAETVRATRATVERVSTPSTGRDSDG